MNARLPDIEIRTCFKMAVMVAVPLLLGACSPYPDSQNMHWSMPEARKEIQVDWVELTQPVGFKPGDAQLSDEQKAQLVAFLEQSRFAYGDKLFVSAGRSALEGQRRSTVAAFLQSVGYAPSQMADNGQSGDVTVVIGRYVATPPACPDWRKPADTDRGNTSLSNLGCATASNLADMVANPGDLVRGRQPGPLDGEASALGIQRYRQGKITPLDVEGTSEDK
jgi:pilus assembly protein CpaD